MKASWCQRRLLVVDALGNAPAHSTERLCAALGARLNHGPSGRHRWSDAGAVVLWLTEFDDAATQLASLAGIARWHRVIVISASMRAADIEIARACGARGYLWSNSTIEEIGEAIRKVANGAETWPACTAYSSLAMPADDQLTMPAPRRRLFLSATSRAAVIALGVAASLTLVPLCRWPISFAPVSAGLLALLFTKTTSNNELPMTDIARYIVNRQQSRYSRLLHDHVLQTIESLLTVPEIRDERLRGLLSHEAAWLRELVDCPGRVVTSDVRSGLAAAADRFRRQALEVSLSVQPELAARALPPQTADAIVGSVTAALGNVVKHAGVAEVTVTAAFSSDGEIVATVADRGWGFALSSATLGFGIYESIGHRMAAVGGHCRITSTEGAGTVVTLTCPAPDVAPPCAEPPAKGRR